MATVTDFGSGAPVVAPANPSVAAMDALEDIVFGSVRLASF